MDEQIAELEQAGRAWAALRRFARGGKRLARLEKCELCAAPLAEAHQHLLEPASRKIVCACDACALLFDVPGGRYRRIGRDPRRLHDFQLTDAQWDELLIPINVAFLYQSSTAHRVLAIYPSPAGPTESLLTFDSWQEIVAGNALLQSMSTDVEALLINRLGPRRGFAENQYYLVPIDECYRLVGLVRSHWRGLSGGEAVWDQILNFFNELAARSAAVSNRGSSHANA